MIGERARQSYSASSGPSRYLLPLGLLGAAALGLGGGLAVSLGNPLIPFALIAGLLAIPLLLAAGIQRLIVAAAAIAVLLPFATLPIKLIITPALLEIVLLFLYAVWLARLLRGGGLNASPVHLPLLIFVALSLFSLILNSPRISGDEATSVVHNYFRLLLGIILFYVVVSSVNYAQAKQLASCLILAGGAAGALGLGLWALPDSLAERLLRGLKVIGYPTDKVIRYVEDNPAKGERAIGTSVDPNSYAGMLVVVFTLALSQLLAKKEERLLPQWLLLGCVGASGFALLLTQSRSVWIGAAAAALFLALVRYRRLFLYGGLGLVAVFGLGIGGKYLARLQEGLALQDPAQVMRLNEYRNAFDIIQRYPYFGVGFGRSGELTLTTGVSSVYLTIATRMGLIGLASFAFVFFAFFAYVLPRLRSRATTNTVSNPNPQPNPPPQAGSGLDREAARTLLLGLVAAVIGALVVGLPDHYYFNIEFPHMSALLWLYVGLAVVLAKAVDEFAQRSNDGTGHRRDHEDDPPPLPLLAARSGGRT